MRSAEQASGKLHHEEHEGLEVFRTEKFLPLRALRVLRVRRLTPRQSLFYFDPGTVSAPVGEDRDQLPNAGRHSRGFGVQVELPFAVPDAELVSRCRRVLRSGIQRGSRRRRVAVLDRLQKMRSGPDRLPSLR